MAEQHTPDRHYGTQSEGQYIETDPVRMAYSRAGGLDPDQTTDAMGIDDKINLYMSLRRQQKQSETDADILKSIANDIEGEIVEYMGETQTSKISRQGMTLYLHTDYWPALQIDSEDGKQRDRDEVKSELISRLKSDLSTASMVTETYNTNTLRSWIMHEHRDNLGVPQVPDHLADLVQMMPRTKAKVTAAKR